MSCSFYSLITNTYFTPHDRISGYMMTDMVARTPALIFGRNKVQISAQSLIISLKLFVVFSLIPGKYWDKATTVPSTSFNIIS